MLRGVVCEAVADRHAQGARDQPVEVSLVLDRRGDPELAIFEHEVERGIHRLLAALPGDLTDGPAAEVRILGPVHLADDLIVPVVQPEIGGVIEVRNEPRP